MNAQKLVSVLGVFNADLKFLVDRFPETGETLHGLSFEIQPGGKGFNQAIGCRRAMDENAAGVAMLTQLGKDNFADLARSVMTREGIDDSQVLVTDKMPTGTAMIMVEKPTADNMIVIAPGAASLLGATEILTFEDTIAKSGLLMTNLEIPMEAAMAGLKLARAHGVTTLLDPAPAVPLSDDLITLLDIVTPNESEAAVLVGFDVNTLDDAQRAGEALCARGVGTAVITMGGLGVVVVTKDGAIRQPAFKIDNVVDTTGAGDAFNGCFAAYLAEGHALKNCVRFASAGAALCVGKYGAADAMPDRQQIEAFLQTH